MPELDLSAAVNAAIGGGAVWAAIRTEIKFLWKAIERLEKKIE